MAGGNGFSSDAVRVAREALRRGSGEMAQFDHPELGGHGQWMHGMLMIGDMSNHTLKARVDRLFQDLLQALPADDEPICEQPAAEPSRNSASFSYGATPAKSASWYPAELGTPGATGGQNEVRYAYFPETRRLAIDLHGKVTLYETGDHRISGISQGQRDDAGSMTFTSQHGVVSISSLCVVK